MSEFKVGDTVKLKSINHAVTSGTRFEVGDTLIVHNKQNIGKDIEQIHAKYEHEEFPDLRSWVSPEDVELYESKPDQETVGMKFSKDKLRTSLLTRSLVKPITAVAAVLTYGSKKYDSNNWQGVDPEEYEDALDRHLNAWRAGETVDPDTGIHHLAHAATNVLFLLWFEVKDNTLQELSEYIDPTEQYREERENAQK